jgi:hypothetical protein
MNPRVLDAPSAENERGIPQIDWAAGLPGLSASHSLLRRQGSVTRAAFLPLAGIEPNLGAQDGAGKKETEQNRGPSGWALTGETRKYRVRDQSPEVEKDQLTSHEATEKAYRATSGGEPYI